MDEKPCVAGRRATKVNGAVWFSYNKDLADGEPLANTALVESVDSATVGLMLRLDSASCVADTSGESVVATRLPCG